ncbi:MAG TPA: DUF1697 domain-containing protein [Candidatus Nanoarchaeia archaeon]|nr:DUF1697 domain-containing protein [Candidatus Nanoarchaeia archaeon]
MKYIAFLRGINVSGQKLIKMEVLREIFSAKFKNVKTYIQSGNVVFESNENADSVKEKSQNIIKKKLGHDVGVFIRTISQIEEIIRKNPFKKKKLSEDETAYVTLLPKNTKIKTPMKSKNGDVEVFASADDAAFCISRKINGKGSFPNGFIEKELKIRATTRNWNTIENISKM